MKDNLERYISENRLLFDDQEPANEVWDKISVNIGNQGIRKNNKLSILWKAAAAVIIFVASYFFHDYIQQEKKHTATLAYKGNKIVFIKRKVNNKPFETTLQQQPQKQQEPINKNNTANNPIYKNIPKEDITDENQDLKEMQAYYTIQINNTENEIYKYANYNTNIKRQIKEEFSQLDSIYSGLRKDLKDNIDNSEVIEAMIQNYRIRLEILENILNQLKGKESNETNKKRYEI